MNWISVKDSLPKEMDQYIVNSYVPGAKEENVVACAVFSEGKWYSLECWGNNDRDNNDEIELKHISHYMPLPSPAKHGWQPMKEDMGMGKCCKINCQNWAEIDYNNHGHYVCMMHYDSLNREFDEEYK